MSKPKRWSKRRWILTAILVLVLVPTMLVGAAFAWVQIATRGKIHAVADSPSAPVAIVFGAGVWGNQPSPYLRYRLEGAKELYDEGKVKAILVSGDNSTKNYDEPSAMRDWLVDNGVPSDVIVLDYAGFSTLDTCGRAKKVFGVDKAVAVTQDYHVRRAVFTCQQAGISTTGVGVPAIGGPLAKYQAREYLATVNAAIDAIAHRQPTFLGPREDGIDKILAR